jgi:hypothetical protein
VDPDGGTGEEGGIVKPYDETHSHAGLVLILVICVIAINALAWVTATNAERIEQQFQAVEKKRQEDAQSFLYRSLDQRLQACGCEVRK